MTDTETLMRTDDVDGSDTPTAVIESTQDAEHDDEPPPLDDVEPDREPVPTLDEPPDLRPTFVDDDETPVFTAVCAELRNSVPGIVAELHDDDGTE